MEILNLNDISKLPASVALGYFDGVHLGHQEVINKTINGANNSNYISTIFTFLNIPFVKIKNHKKNYELMNINEKINIFKNLGIQRLYFVDFKKIINFSPRYFIEEILIKILNAKEVYCGTNYTFGKNGEGNTDILRLLCDENKIKLCVVEPMFFKKEVISSTKIREALLKGDMDLVKSLMGRYYQYYLEVIRGNGIGKKIGIPTINQNFFKNFVVPKFGVYASITFINNKKYYSVTNIGVKPTVGSEYPLSETWVPKYKGDDLYFKRIKVQLIKYIRNEKKFNNLEELKIAINKDAENAKYILNKIKLI